MTDHLANLKERAVNTRERAQNAHISMRAAFAGAADDFEWAIETIDRLVSLLREVRQSGVPPVWQQGYIVVQVDSATWDQVDALLAAHPEVVKSSNPSPLRAVYETPEFKREWQAAHPERRTALADTLRERDALEKQRDEALLALSELCESCGGKEPHTLAHCTAHLKTVLTLLQQVRPTEQWRAEAEINRVAWLKACDERDTALALLREVEWGGVWDTDPICAICERRKHKGHSPDCRLAAFLAAHPEGTR